jgi:hypothetical protein
LNSFREADTALSLIAASLAALRAEHPAAYTQLARQMAGRQAQISIAGEDLTLTFTAEAISVAPGAAGEALRLTTDWATLLALVDAELSLVEAVLTGRCDLLGEARELAVFYDALLLYLRGGLRCPSFPALLDRMRLLHAASLA